MPITIEWDTGEHHAIRYDFVGQWTWDEFRDCVKKVHHMIAAQDYPVCSIGDFSHSGQIPRGAMQQVQWSIKSGPPNVGPVIIANANPFVAIIARTFTHVYRDIGSKIAVARDLDEARQIAADFYAENSQKST